MNFIYAEDNQMYYTNYFLVNTNYDGSLEQLSWKPTEAGRFSTSVYTLKNLVEKEGFKFKVLKDIGKSLPNEFKKYPIVRGATGNY